MQVGGEYIFNEPLSLSFKAARCREVENEDVAGLESLVVKRDVRRGGRAMRVKRKDMARAEIWNSTEGTL
jgi:hypothetical protein